MMNQVRQEKRALSLTTDDNPSERDQDHHHHYLVKSHPDLDLQGTDLGTIQDRYQDHLNVIIRGRALQEINPGILALIRVITTVTNVIVEGMNPERKRSQRKSDKNGWQKCNKMQKSMKVRNGSVCKDTWKKVKRKTKKAKMLNQTNLPLL
jgi:hypothetical protein